MGFAASRSVVPNELNLPSAAQQIKFAKMPVRDRSGSSPIRGSHLKGEVEVLVTSPSRRSVEGRLRGDSLGAVDAVKQRERRDTGTSSDLSSDNELDPSLFRRRTINTFRAARNNNLLTQKHEEDERQQMRSLAPTKIDEGLTEDSDKSSLSSGFGEAADSESLLEEALASSSIDGLGAIQNAALMNPPSPKKARSQSTNLLSALPPSRPISTIQSVSLLGQAIKASRTKPKNPIEIYAGLSGIGALDPLNIRIYTPFSETPMKPFEMPLQRMTQQSHSGDKVPVTVADAIGLSVWRYSEERLKPPLEGKKLDINRWTLRMIDDGEVEYDFPALSRTRPMTDFTSNNNRAARGRSREKLYDEFALVEATEAQYREHKALTPLPTQDESAIIEEAAEDTQQRMQGRARGISKDSKGDFDQRPSFGPRKLSTMPADKPATAQSHSTPRMGPSKMLKIHFTSLEANTQTNTIEVTTDTYIAEVLDIVCKKFKLDKAYHILKVSGTNTIAPLDRIVETLGVRTDLDLIRRRFANDGAIGGAGSPGSSSPNAPLLLMTETAKKGKRALHPLAQKQDLYANTSKFKRYNVIRKQPMSFTPSHQRILLLDEDYMHILPAETGKTLFDNSGKSTMVPFSMIVGCKVSRKHPKSFRVIIFEERGTKRYDFEAQNTGEAVEIVAELQKAMEPYHANVQGIA